MRKFSRGIVSKIFNINKEKLRYYSDIGLLKPHINEKNNYSEYSIEDLFLLSAILRARYIGTSIADIRDVKKVGSISEYNKFLDKQLIKTKSEIQKLKEIERIISINREIALKIESFKNNFDFLNLKQEQIKKNFYVFDMETSIEKAMKYKEFFNIYELENIFILLNTEADNIFSDVDKIWIEDKVDNELLKHLISSDINYEKIEISDFFIREKFLGTSDEIKKYVLDIINKSNFKFNDNLVMVNKLLSIPCEDSIEYFVDIFIKL